MKDELFTKIVAVVVAIGLISSVALAAYTVHLYKQCSILNYIANERD